MPPLNGQDGNGSGLVPAVTYGVLGDSDGGVGILGTSNSGEGVFAESNGSNAVHGRVGNVNSSGVFGENGNGGDGVTGRSSAGRHTSAGRGVHGVTGKGSGTTPPHPGTGVWGDADAGTGVCGTSVWAEGVYGTTQSSNHAAVAGINKSKANDVGSNPGHGVYGETQSWSYDAAGVYGKSTIGHGVLGRATDQGYGVSGESSGGVGVKGTSNVIGMWADGGRDTGLIVRADYNGLTADCLPPGPSFDSLAGLFNGPVLVTGFLHKAGAGFKIDHPLDPAKKYLFHSFVESSERKNIYDGIAVLNAKGEATVKLPAWFGALNRDFRYQLTAIGAPAPNLHITQKIAKGTFKIGGGQSKMEVSWQVTGVRKDRWAAANAMSVEQRKPTKEKGFYLHAELYGKGEEKSILWARLPHEVKRTKEARSKSSRTPE